jgi:hypothetical protein
MSPTRAGASTALTTSLRELVRSRKRSFSIGDIIDRFEGHGGLAQVLFILTLPVLLPLPPGASMVLALPLLLVAPQMMAGRKTLWMPHWLTERTLERKTLVRLVRRIMKPLGWMEGLAKPRLQWLTGRAGTRLVALVATIIAVVLVLPIPFANLLPAIALCLFALGLARQDGVMVLGGYAVLGVSVTIIVFGAHGLRLLFHHIMALV